MKVLAFDSSTDLCTVALTAHGACLERAVQGTAVHSGAILPLIRELLVEAGLSLNELDGIAVGTGPGAFTGLRLACGVAQGLAMGAGLRLAAVGSLEAVAWASGEEHCFVAMDARLGELYCAAYQRNAGGGLMQVVGEPVCVAPAMAVLPAHGSWVGCGNGFGCFPELASQLGERLVRVGPPSLPVGRAVAELGALALQQGRVVDPGLAVPHYVRDKVAQTTAERLAAGGRG